MKRMLGMTLVAVLAGCASPHAGLSTEDNVDLHKYAGTWHEQARLPNRFQEECLGDVRANYSLPLGSTTLKVVNQCRARDGSIKVAEGEGRLAGGADSRDTSKLEVRFAPQWTSWLLMVWGDYWIIRLDEGYQYSLVGTPDRQYLWVLSRNKAADGAVVTQLLDYARTQGFNTDRVIMTPD